jgi:hypothetical protein
VGGCIDLTTALPALQSETSATPIDIVVVDQASERARAGAVTRQFPHVGFIENPHNDGFAAGVNRGAPTNTLESNTVPPHSHRNLVSAPHPEPTSSVVPWRIAEGPKQVRAQWTKVAARKQTIIAPLSSRDRTERSVAPSMIFASRRSCSSPSL